MKGKKLFIGIAAVVLLILLVIMRESFSQPGIQDLAGDYKRIAFYKNENNTGPVQRLYAVSTSDTLWQEMEKYGAYMPHTKYGTTRVYFFAAESPAPSTLLPEQEALSPEYQPYCLAIYEKNNIGQISFIRYPYR